jgi:trk system potassium uptake protein TrkA
MKQFAIIGLGAFGIWMLEELSETSAEVIIIDKDKEVIEKYKDLCKAAYVSDAINAQAIEKIVPGDIDAAIVDLGGKIEVSIMATNYLKKLGIKDIIVKAQSVEHGEVLSMVGATKVIFPDREAAKRVVPMLTSSLLFNFLPISVNLALAEVGVNASCVGKTLIETDLRKSFGLNVVAMRKSTSEEFLFISDPLYRFEPDDVLLVAGSEACINRFSSEGVKPGKSTVQDLFRTLFPEHRKTE